MKTAERQIECYNKKHMPIIYKIKNQILLNSKDIQCIRFCKKTRLYEFFDIETPIKKTNLPRKIFLIFRNEHSIFYV